MKVAQHRGAMDIEKSESLVPFETTVLPFEAVLVKVAQHHGAMDIERSERLVPGGDCSAKMQDAKFF